MSGAATVAQPFVTGGICGMCASTIVHPIDLSKVRIQLFSTMNPGTTKVCTCLTILTIILNCLLSILLFLYSLVLYR
jgi:hypothetical protein